MSDQFSRNYYQRDSDGTDPLRRNVTQNDRAPHALERPGLLNVSTKSLTLSPSTLAAPNYYFGAGTIPLGQSTPPRQNVGPPGNRA